MKQKDIVTFYGKIRSAVNKPTDPDAGGLTHFQINTKYINNTRQIIRAKLRSNLELSFPAVAQRRPYAHEETFIVRKELVVSAVCINAMRNYFSGLNEEDSELDLFRRVYLQVHENIFRFNQTQELRCAIEYTFSEQDLKDHGGVFYHDGLDTLFKLGDSSFTIPHPNSPQGRQDEIEQQAVQLRDEHGFVFWVEIIDNLERYSERYIPICNQVYKISPKKDKNRPDGLYIVSSSPSNGKIVSTEISTRHYPMENIEKELGIYASFDAAKANGDIAGARKREWQEREHEFTREKQAWAERELQLKREAADRDRQLKDAESERARNQHLMEDLRNREAHLMEMQRLQSKDKYEERQADRKDASEMIKFLPVILTGIGTILMAYQTFKKSS